MRRKACFILLKTILCIVSHPPNAAEFNVTVRSCETLFPMGSNNAYIV